MTIILWIDPGTTTIGYAIVERVSNTFTLRDYGVIETPPKLELSKKLIEIGNDMSHIIAKYKPDVVSVEKLYFTTNLKTGIDVAHARWVILYEIEKSWLTLLEYTPLQVKKAITSNGQAQKKQLQNAIKMIFRLTKIPKPDDAADAIGLAYMWALNTRA